MKAVALLTCAFTAVNAFPFVLDHLDAGIQKRDYAQAGCSTSALCNKYIAVSDAQASIPASENAATRVSKSRDNCGFLHKGQCTTFDAASQRVSTTGQYAYQSPGPNDIRGPCPGLNAAANHGYLKRSGLSDITNTITGLGNLYGMSVDLAGFLAAYAIAFDGDVVTQQWSIGGPLPANLLSGALGRPEGISYSHNNYEGDTSIGRCDAYINGGDAHSLSTTRFATAYASGTGNPSGNPKSMRYTLDTMSRLAAKNTIRSISTNPYYFAPLFSTTLVAPAAYNFVINFMSNHSSAVPGGYLDGAQFKTFFGISGNYPNFVWNKGQERIPDNWYKRPVAVQYNAVDVFGDLIPEFAAYPATFRFGGNTNGVNTYTGVDIANLTGGAYNAQTLFQGNNFGCFFLQTEQQAIPLQLQGGVNDVAKATALVLKYLTPLSAKLGCPALSKYDNSVFQKYTGKSYAPTANPSGYRANC
ncbi:Dothistromin biosynthesis peroxidase dotB [Pseudocercospora fuligena]|uniref:Dothistromin biosynthesis peroxidase dotB n=1 Tax=Pseudocercospora fuligena TaxID=685502 RepID=A0A8H6RMJ1_9PEZI|nr:Dothistromin biosynthesis peroxidase dotB [Pseudocercospora fuligena]